MKIRNLSFIALLLILTCALLASCNIFVGDGGADGNGTGDNKGDVPSTDGHTHTLVKVDAVAPTCGAAGSAEHYACEDCGKLFADVNGKNEISAPIAITPLAHKWSDAVIEGDNGFYVKCLNCDAKKSVSLTEASSYSAVKDNEFKSSKSYEITMGWGSKGMTHNGGNDKTTAGAGFMGGIDATGEYVYYQFEMEKAGTVDFIWNIAGNNYSDGKNLGIANMAANMSITIDGKPVSVNGIELPAINGDDYMEMWWKLQQVVVKDVVLDAGIHTFKCDIIAKGGVNIAGLTVKSTKPLTNDVQPPRANVTSTNLLLENNRAYYVLTYDVHGYGPEDFEFFDGTEIYPFTSEVDGDTITFKIDFTDYGVRTFYPHLRLEGKVWDNNKGDVIIVSSPNYHVAYSIGCRNYKLAPNFDMPCVIITDYHDYVPSVITPPTTSVAGKGEARCKRCNIRYDLVEEIELPPLSADNGYKVVDGAVKHFTYVHRAFTDIHTYFEFNFDLKGSQQTENYTFDAVNLFGEIGSTDAEYNANGYYEGKIGDSFVFVVSSPEPTTAKLTLVGADTLGAISDITVNGRESNAVLLGDTLALVLEKGTNTVKFTLDSDVNISAISLDSAAEISTIKAEDAYGLTLMSYNIRLDADSGFMSWSQRKTHLANHILSYSPDVICFQEVMQNQYNDLVTLIGEVYEVVWYARQGGTNPEGLAVAYKKADFTEQSRTMFWLSETPEVESMGWDAYAYLRIAVNVIVKHNASGQMLNVFSVHLDGHQREACHKSMELVMSRAAEYDYPVYIAGDFNANDLSYAYHLTDVNYHDAKAVSPITDCGHTGSSWYGGINKTGRPIDHIFVSPEYFIPTEYKICRDRWGDGYFHSDHFAIISRVLFIKPTE